MVHRYSINSTSMQFNCHDGGGRAGGDASSPKTPLAEGDNEWKVGKPSDKILSRPLCWLSCSKPGVRESGDQSALFRRMSWGLGARDGRGETSAD